LPNVKKTKRLLPVLHDNQIRERKKENWLWLGSLPYPS
jgi:hypothetical protein